MVSLKEYRIFTLMAVFIVSVFLPGIAVAQDGTGVIYGTVTGPAGGVITNCEVNVEGTNIVGQTGLNGSYRLAPVPVGEHTLVFSYLGLQTANAEVTVTAGEAVSQDMTLVYGGEIEVRGSPLLVGQAKALNRQKNAINIKNIVAADQIGRFPDKNAAEATQRIPGVSLNRDMGEGRYIIIRGTEARLNSTTVNGERIPSPEAGVRNVALDTIPADLLQSIEVSKALRPDMDGDSIGGTVDLVTRRAPEETRVSVSLGTGYSALMEETAPNGSFTFGGRVGDEKKWGLLLTGSASDTKRGADNIEPEYDDGYLDTLEFRDYTTERERYGVTADIDYRASQRSNYYLRGLWTNYVDTELRRRKTMVVADDELERDIKDRTQESLINSISFGGENTIGESMVLDYRLMYNKSSEETINQLTSGFVQEDIEYLTNVSPDHINPDNIQAIPLNESAALLEFDEIEDQTKIGHEEDIVGAINFTKGFYKNAGYSGLWKFGAKARFKNKVQDYNVWDLESEDDFNMLSVIDNWNSETPFFNGNYGDQIIPFFDPAAMRALVESGVLESERNLEEDLADYDITEDTLAAYVLGEFILGANTSLMGGVRVESTKDEYIAYEWLDGEDSVSPVTGDKSYTEWLPQFHLVYKTGEDSQLRAAVTRSMARPNFEDMAPWIYVNDEDFEIVKGNPDLDVTTAWNLDLMWEKYLQPVGIFSAGVFYKDLTDYIYIFQVDEVIDGEDYEVEQPRNGDKATLAGFELAFQNQFTNWNGFWGGIGLYGNYTYVDSEAEYPDRESTSLPGQSKNIGNLALVYEKYGVTTRLSYNYNGKKLLEVGGDIDEDIWVDDHAQLDFLFRVQVAKRWAIIFEAINITDEPYTAYEGTADRIRQQEFYSWWATLGVRFDL
ncbi:MAG: TonB-dependent receptor [Acidobacteria bacterium]|nr:TonB-dependent receptor [Candidatus Sulfomarinibacter sp. MAG AM2]